MHNREGEMSMGEYISREEHEEFTRRMEDEHVRLSHRIKEIKGVEEQNNKILIAMEKMALNMEGMQKELAEQGQRLLALENKDGDMWRAVVKYVITTIIGIAIGCVASQIGL